MAEWNTPDMNAFKSKNEMLRHKGCNHHKLNERKKG